MKKFKIKRYEIQSKKIKNHAFKAVMVSDLHNVEFGNQNETLLQKIKEEAPDMILLAGDLVLGKEGASTRPAFRFLEEAVKLAPVFYAPGNHEQRMKLFPQVYGREYLVFEKKAKRLGVIFLENETREYEVKGEKILLSGLALPYKYYKKGIKLPLEKKLLIKLLGKASAEQFQILLAHTPKYGSDYLEWGADLTFSGHYHGGMIRVPFLGGVISPDFRIFPKYCHGIFEKNNSRLIVGAGLGEHTIPLRIFNPRELVVVTCSPSLGNME